MLSNFVLRNRYLGHDQRQNLIAGSLLPDTSLKHCGPFFIWHPKTNKKKQISIFFQFITGFCVLPAVVLT